MAHDESAKVKELLELRIKQLDAIKVATKILADAAKCRVKAERIMRQIDKPTNAYPPEEALAWLGFSIGNKNDLLEEMGDPGGRPNLKSDVKKILKLMKEGSE